MHGAHNQDPEHGGSHHPAYDDRNGYPSVASWIARDPDSELYIFRRFNWLSARDLLHLQSEVLELEHALKELDARTFTSPDLKVKQTLRKWEDLVRDAGTQHHSDNESSSPSGSAERTAMAQSRMALVREIARKMKEYRMFETRCRPRSAAADREPEEALLLQSHIATLSRPSDRILRIYWKYFRGPIDKNDWALGGKAMTLLDDAEDLAALKVPSDKDPLSKFLQNNWPLYNQVRHLTGNAHGKAGFYPEDHVSKTSTAISTTMAALLLIGPVVCFYFVQHPVAVLGLIIDFLVLFALALRLVTTATKDVAFGATCAYAAVLVVFISGGLGKNNGLG